MLLVKLFVTFFKIGLFSFGGGYGMLSVIQGEVVTRYEWLSMAEFTDIVAIRQMTPGPIGINSATYVGYTAMNNAYGSVPLAVIGSLTASFAVMLPSLVLMLIISRYLMKYSKDTIEAMGSGTTFKEVSGKTMKSLKVRIPADINYQKRIAALLDSIDSRIENNEKINDNLAA